MSNEIKFAQSWSNKKASHLIKLQGELNENYNLIAKLHNRNKKILDELNRGVKPKRLSVPQRMDK